ncbi:MULTISPECIES: alpha-L-rhamnosidase C-terminal domain-containing protein [unclassified Streptomyces]|uniref:alpha-L-rhamnosidase C-terminal domain-containing protein n=1 Tax=unclassified Streptomyces TaxID=2593676 RepID=UPI00114C924B|nr:MULTISPECIES: alpha-L-rhamnosidase C-terminal domain-containing protein [unclassified Streptomyces]MYS19564.1 hypothetical protein [Streptomyces sp. SID4948]
MSVGGTGRGAVPRPGQGLAPDPDGAPTYRVAPHPGGVGRAEGRLTTPAGVIAASWRDRGRGGFDLDVDAGAVSEIAVPVPDSGTYVVRVDGRTAWDRTARAYSARVDGGRVVLAGVPAGSRTVTVRKR